MCFETEKGQNRKYIRNNRCRFGGDNFPLPHHAAPPMSFNMQINRGQSPRIPRILPRIRLSPRIPVQAVVLMSSRRGEHD
jgi:hypothetical protein